MFNSQAATKTKTKKNSTGENKPNQEGCVGGWGELIKRGTCSSNLYALLQSLQGSVIKQIVEEVLFLQVRHSAHNGY